MDPRYDLSFCAFTTAWLAPELLGSIGPSPHLWFLHAKQRLLDQSTSLLGYQTSPVVLCMQNSVICTRIKRLYGFQLSLVLLCMQNSDFRTRITSLWRRIDRTCCLCKQNNDFWTRITSLYGSQTSPVIFCLQNSMPSFRITSLYWSQSSSVFLHSKQRLWTRITNLYGSQTSPVVLYRQYSVISTRITCLYRSQRLSEVFACITATFGPEYKFSMGTRPHLSFLHAKQRLLDQNNKSLWVPDMTYRFVHVQQCA